MTGIVPGVGGNVEKRQEGIEHLGPKEPERVEDGQAAGVVGGKEGVELVVRAACD